MPNKFVKKNKKKLNKDLVIRLLQVLIPSYWSTTRHKIIRANFHLDILFSFFFFRTRLSSKLLRQAFVVVKETMMMRELRPRNRLNNRV